MQQRGVGNSIPTFHKPPSKAGTLIKSTGYNLSPEQSYAQNFKVNISHATRGCRELDSNFSQACDKSRDTNQVGTCKTIHMLRISRYYYYYYYYSQLTGFQKKKKKKAQFKVKYFPRTKLCTELRTKPMVCNKGV